MEEMTIWEQYTITLNRDPRRGFGIAIAGGRDRPSSKDGDQSIIVSDIVPGGPADNRLQTRDHIVMVNGVSMENVTSSFAIHTLKSCLKTANVTVKRPRKIQLPGSNSVPPVSTGLSHGSRASHTSELMYSNSLDKEGREEADSSVAWRERYGSFSREPHEDTARGYEGDSSSGRSSGGSTHRSSYHSRQHRLKGVGSGAGNYSRKRAGNKKKQSSDRESVGSNRWRETGSGRGYSGSDAGDYSRTDLGSDIVEQPYSGLELVSGFKRLPVQDVPSKPVKTILVKQTESQEYGLKLGSQIFIKHITDTGLAAQEKSLQEGDLILKINGVASENMSLADTRRLIEKSKGKLTLTVLRDNRQFLVNIPQVNDSDSEDRNSVQDDISELSSDHSPPPSQPPPPPPAGQISWQNSLNSLESPVHEFNGTHSLQSDDVQNKNYPRVSPQLHSEYREEPEQASDKQKDDLRVGYSPDARLIQFTKGKSIGLRLAGGNDVGIFVAAVQEGSPAAIEGMKEGDQILQVAAI
ncbi:PREDICTED: tight junction protein ZO-3-like [Nanorana parkeri]|uniref:tight junction protein ZO-3-like n=1 Tax=Nanorana parkeri TaxID=125878 RepID=UPI000854941D|nr:PREDICTED: tight junction protein ZO-3-like [Nanorana parkeri]